MPIYTWKQHVLKDTQGAAGAKCHGCCIRCQDEDCADYEDGHDGMNDHYESERKHRAVDTQQQTQLAKS